MNNMMNPTKKETMPKEAEKKFVADRARAMGSDIKQDATEEQKKDPRLSRLISLANERKRTPEEEVEFKGLQKEYPDFDTDKVGR